MKKLYENPEIVLEKIVSADIIASSVEEAPDDMVEDIFY